MPEDIRDSAAQFNLPGKDANTHELLLTPEQAAKSDADIRTYESLASYATEHGGIAGLTDGYAVDAQCNGAVTRPHGDLDIDMFFSSPHDAEQTRSDLIALVSASGGRWRIHEPENASRSSADLFELHEDDDLKPQPLRRKIAVKVYTKKHPAKHMHPAVIRDSLHNEHQVLARGVEDLFTRKVIALFPHGKSYGENPRVERRVGIHEVYDMRRLMNHPSFDRGRILSTLSEDALRKGKYEHPDFPEEQAQRIAEQLLSTAELFLSSHD